MSPEISEKAFEDAIECALLAGGEDACKGWPMEVRERAPAYGEGVPGGYYRRTSDEYDRSLCLIRRDLVDFVVATQPKTWSRRTSRIDSSRRWPGVGRCRTCLRSRSRPRPSRRRWSSSGSAGRRARTPRSASTPCVRRSRSGSSSTCWRTTRPTTPTGACTRRWRTIRATRRGRRAGSSSRSPHATQAQLYAFLKPIVDRVVAKTEEERRDFRRAVREYVRLFSFLSQILKFQDADLERMYVFCRLLRPYLPPERVDLPREVQQKIEMDSYRIQETFKGRINLDRGTGTLDPQKDKNERFGTSFTEKDKVSLARPDDAGSDRAALGDHPRAGGAAGR